MSAPKVVVSEVVEIVDDGYELTFPILSELFCGTVEEARELYKDEPEVIEELDRLLKHWPSRRPGETSMETVFDLGAMGRFAVTLVEQVEPAWGDE